MLFVNKISRILKHDQKNGFESENTQKILLLNFTIVAAAILNLIFAVNHYLFFEKPTAYLLFCFFILFTFIFFIFKQTKNYEVWSLVIILLLTSLFLFLAIAGSGGNTGIIWGLTYPIIVSLTFNVKKSAWFSLIFLILLIAVFFLPLDSLTDYPDDLKVRYIAAYIAILLYLQYYLRIKQQAVYNRTKKIIDVQQKIREKDEFLSKLSYQIRTPLNNIAGIINLKRDVLGNEVVEEAELSVSNLVTIVNSIPESFEKGLLQIKGEKTLFNINSTIRKSVNLFQTEKYSTLKCSLHLSNKIPQFVFADRLTLIQIVISAVDFFFNSKNKESLKVDVISAMNDSLDTILVKIRAQDNFHFFKPLVKNEFDVEFDKIENKELLMIKELTTSLSGQYKINYRDTETSFLFAFNFPDTKEKKQDQTSSAVNNNFFQSKTKKDLSEATVLLVEDDVMNSKVMTLNIQKYVKKIIIAVNGKDALEKYASTRVDIILMDIRMPLMDGFKTTEKIREAEMGIGYHIPIIAVTANASSEIKKRCFEVGMNDYTTKPTNFKLLLKKMKAQLN